MKFERDGPKRRMIDKESGTRLEVCSTGPDINTQAAIVTLSSGRELRFSVGQINPEQISEPIRLAIDVLALSEEFARCGMLDAQQNTSFFRAVAQGLADLKHSLMPQRDFVVVCLARTEPSEAALFISPELLAAQEIARS